MEWVALSVESLGCGSWAGWFQGKMRAVAVQKYRGGILSIALWVGVMTKDLSEKNVPTKSRHWADKVEGESEEKRDRERESMMGPGNCKWFWYGWGISGMGSE